MPLPIKRAIVLLVRNGHDAEHHGPSDNGKEHSARKNISRTSLRTDECTCIHCRNQAAQNSVTIPEAAFQENNIPILLTRNADTAQELSHEPWRSPNSMAKLDRLVLGGSSAEAVPTPSAEVVSHFFDFWEKC